jgi:hypothetical protein
MTILFSSGDKGTVILFMPPGTLWHGYMRVCSFIIIQSSHVPKEVHGMGFCFCNGLWVLRDYRARDGKGRQWLVDTHARNNGT